MDKKLQLLLHLYGEKDSPGELEELLRDEELRVEFGQLMATKRALETRRELSHANMRPDPAVLSRVMQRAAARRPRFEMQRLRAGKPHSRRIRHLVGWPTVALAAAIAGILFWPQDIQQPSSVPGAGEAAGMEQSTVLPPWDDGSQLVNVNNHIEVLNSRSVGETWDEPELLSLDSLPAPGPSGGFTPASVSH